MDKNVNYYYNNPSKMDRFEDKKSYVGRPQYDETLQYFPHYFACNKTDYFGNNVGSRYNIPEPYAHDSRMIRHDRNQIGCTHYDDLIITDYHDERGQQSYYTKIC